MDVARALEGGHQSEGVGGEPVQLGRLLPEQTFAVAIAQNQPLLIVERQDGDIDLRHYGTKQRRRFLCAQALVAECVRQRVDFHHHGPERLAFTGGTGADGEVALTKGREQVGDGLQGAIDVLGEANREPEPDAKDPACQAGADRQSPSALPQQQERDRHRGQSGGEREELHAPDVADHSW
ncbi:MAG: hypothetical protein AB7L71_10145 [Vicinamibacterales bacterium]